MDSGRAGLEADGGVTAGRLLEKVSGRTAVVASLRNSGRCGLEEAGPGELADGTGCGPGRAVGLRAAGADEGAVAGRLGRSGSTRDGVGAATDFSGVALGNDLGEVGKASGPLCARPLEVRGRTGLAASAAARGIW